MSNRCDDLLVAEDGHDLREMSGDSIRPEQIPQGGDLFIELGEECHTS